MLSELREARSALNAANKLLDSVLDRNDVGAWQEAPLEPAMLVQGQNQVADAAAKSSVQKIVGKVLDNGDLAKSWNGLSIATRCWIEQVILTEVEVAVRSVLRFRGDTEAKLAEAYDQIHNLGRRQNKVALDALVQAKKLALAHDAAAPAFIQALDSLIELNFPKKE